MKNNVGQQFFIKLSNSTFHEVQIQKLVSFYIVTEILIGTSQTCKCTKKLCKDLRFKK